MCDSLFYSEDTTLSLTLVHGCPVHSRSLEERVLPSLLSQVSHRFRELMQLFHTACEASSEDEDDATSTSNADQLSDHGDLLSEEELDE